MYLKFNPNEKFTSKTVEDREMSDSLEDFDDAGYILEDDDLVVDIDCLKQETIKEIIKIFKIHTEIVWTDRGAHLYFKKPKGFKNATGTLPLGFKVEYKHAPKTTAVTVKRMGHIRPNENVGSREPLPFIFTPSKAYKDLTNLGEGDGRNNALFHLASQVAQAPEHRLILNFVNKYIFDEPLDDKEFEACAREQSLVGQKDMENFTAQEVVKDLRVVKYKGQLYYYDGVKYVSDTNNNGLKYEIYSYCPDQKTRYIDEVLNQINYKCRERDKNLPLAIKLKNGYLLDGYFIKGDFKDFTPYYIDIEYDPEAKPVPKVDQYLKNFSNGDKDYEKVILEIIGYCLVTDPQFIRAVSKLFIFVGDGGNGKGTFLQIIRNILGDENCCSNDIAQLSDERYLNSLVGKLVNLGDDIQDQPINATQMRSLKTISTADNITVRRLYEKPTDQKLPCKLIFTSNHVIKSYEKGDSVKRRFIWCPIFTKPKHVEFDFISQLTTKEALKYWMKLVVEAYMRLYRNNGFSPSQVLDEYNTQYHRDNDNTIEFVESELPEDEDIFAKKCTDVVKEYREWCEHESLEKPLSKNKLYQTILNKRNFERKKVTRKELHNGRSTIVFWPVDPEVEKELLAKRGLK